TPSCSLMICFIFSISSLFFSSVAMAISPGEFLKETSSLTGRTNRCKAEPTRWGSSGRPLDPNRWKLHGQRCPTSLGPESPLRLAYDEQSVCDKGESRNEALRLCSIPPVLFATIQRYLSRRAGEG